MKFAPVMPASWMPDLNPWGDYHMVQSFTVDTSDNRTMDWLQVQSLNNWVILDNGAYELGEAQQDEYFRIAEEVGPSEIVCPDVPGDAAVTLALMEEHWERCARLMNDGACRSIMIVPQGKSPKEWIDCYEYMVEFWDRVAAYHPTIGVPKYLEVWGRAGIVAYLTREIQTGNPLMDLYNVPWAVHLLGVYSSFDEIVRVDQLFPEVRGADSTWPVAYGLAEGDYGLMPTSGGFKYGIRDEDWRGDYGGHGGLIRANITTCRRLIQWGRLR